MRDVGTIPDLTTWLADFAAAPYSGPMRCRLPRSTVAAGAIVALAWVAAAAQVRRPLGSAFTMAVGSSARVPDAGLTIRFLRVSEDSRCPAGVECFHAGNARVDLSVAVGRREPRTVTLVTLVTGGASRDAIVAGYRVEVVDLAPPPSLSGTPSAKDYVATVRVERVRSTGAAR